MNYLKLIIMLFSSIIGGIYAESIEILLTEKWQFISVALVVILDMLLGVINALIKKEYRTSKALKGVYMLLVFWSMLAVLLSIEKGFPYAAFLSEMILLPIIIFQFISIIKTASVLGLIHSSTTRAILERIDKHKETQK